MFRNGLLVTLILTAVTQTLGQSSAIVDLRPQPAPNSTIQPTDSTTVTTPTTTPTTPTTTPATPKTTPTTPTTTPTTPKTTPTTPTTTPTTPKTTPTTPTTTPTTPTTTPTTPTTQTTPPTTKSTTSPPTPPTTTPSPTSTVVPPVPQPEVGKWSVQNKTTNITCIIADMAVQLNVTHNHKDSQNKTYLLVDVPKNANATGKCGTTKQELQLTWPSGNKTNELIVSFVKNETAKDFSVVFNVTLEIPDGKNVTELKVKSAVPEFTTPDEMSYRCVKAQTLNLIAEGSNVTVAYLTISNAQFEAFHNKTDATFSSAKDCEASGSPDIVPIAVGCALVGLVAIVLIAYLIGRRRSQARGYLSIDGTDSEERR